MASLEPRSKRVEVSEVAMLDAWTQVVETIVRFGASVDRIFNTKSQHRVGVDLGSYNTLGIIGANPLTAMHERTGWDCGF